jgi:hypothetical protein
LFSMSKSRVNEKHLKVLKYIGMCTIFLRKDSM